MPRRQRSTVCITAARSSTSVDQALVNDAVALFGRNSSASGAKQMRIGIDTTVPDKVIQLPPCDMRDPVSVPGNSTPYLKLPTL